MQELVAKSKEKFKQLKSVMAISADEHARVVRELKEQHEEDLKKIQEQHVGELQKLRDTKNKFISSRKVCLLYPLTPLLSSSSFVIESSR